MKDKKIGSVLKTETKVIAYVVICLVVIVLGISYALFFEVKGNEKNQIVKAGTLEFTYANGSQITNETNSECFIPMSEEEALKHSECEYKISITNTGTLPGNYNINLTSDAVDKPLELNKLKVILKKEGQVVSDYPKEGTTTSLVANEKIEAGSVINYTVQVYVDADNELLNADDDEKNISLKINGDAVVNGEEVNPAGPVLAIDYIKNIPTIENGDGLYKVSHDVSEIDKGWNQEEYRYAGTNPNNYVKFNNEIWRIIGVVNVKTGGGIEQRVKIIRVDGINNQKNFGNYSWDKNTESTNNWTTSKLKDMLNGIYFESGIGECYKGSSNETVMPSTCDFKSDTDELPKGLNDISRNMVDLDIIWNLGGYSSAVELANLFYEMERGTMTGNNNAYSNEWSSATDVGGKHNGIGLMYPSDFGYAVGGNNRSFCLNLDLSNYTNESCGDYIWLTISTEHFWTITPRAPYFSNDVFYVTYKYAYSGADINKAGGVWPTLYLKPSVKIVANPNFNQEYGSIDNPFILE